MSESDQIMVSLVLGFSFIGMMLGLLAFVIALASAGRTELIDSYAAQSLGESIGEGIAQAACIKAGGDWKFHGKCDQETTP